MDHVADAPWLKYTQNAKDNPVAPTGLRQQAGLVQRYQQDHQGEPPAWLNGDYSQASRMWLSGGNMQGTENGWDYTDGFNDKWQDGVEEASQNGTLRKYNDFAESKGTGIVSFDYVSDADPERKYRFGDIYEDGEFQGNIYDEKAMGFSKDTANLLLGEFFLDQKLKLEIATSGDETERRAREIEAVKERNQTEIPKQWDALETQKLVEGKQTEYQEGGKDEVGATVAGAAGGAATGAGIGAVAAGPVGALVGGGLGALVGGFGGYMNRDELTQAAARATVVTGMANDEFGTIRGIFTGAKEWAGVAGKTMMPLSNVTRGVYDSEVGTTGDGVEEFYEVNDKGERKAGKGMIALDLAASVGDSLLQFGSPLGRGLYTAQMSTNIAGSTLQLATTGQTFDDRRGGFDPIFRDDEGNIDLSAGAAGIASIGIDVVQLGMVHGLSRSVDSARREAGTMTDATGFLGKTRQGWTDIQSRMGAKVPYSLGGSKGLKEGERIVHASGSKFIVDASGKAVEGSRRMTMSMLAPSEALPYLSTSMMGRRAAAIRDMGPRMVTADDYYRAAISLSSGQMKMRSAFLNAFGEASEEAAQAILEPMSHNGQIDPMQVLESAAYGGAMGLGMSLGTTMRAPNQDQKLRAQANINHQLVFGEEMSDEVWDQMSQAERQASAMMGTQAKEISEAVFKKIKSEQSAKLSANVPEAARLRDAQLAAQESALSKASRKTDGTFVIGQLEHAGEMDEDGNLLPGSMPSTAVGSSAAQLLQNMRMQNEGLKIQQSWLGTRIKELNDKIAKQTATDEEVAELSRRTKELATAELTIGMSDMLNGSLEEIGAEIQAHVEAGDRIAAQASVEELNSLLRNAYNMKILNLPGVDGALTQEQRYALARAATLVWVREPKDQSGSFLSLVPQASMQLTWSNSNNYLQISHAVLSPIGGDFDGDKIRQQAQLLLDDVAFENSRSGNSLLGVAPGPIIGTRDYETYNIDNMVKAMELGDNASALAIYHLMAITKAIYRRYENYAPSEVLDATLQRFQDDVMSANPKARQRLMDMLAEEAGEGIMSRGRMNLENEWLWIDQVVISNLQAFQTAFAMYRPLLGVEDSTSLRDDEKPNTETVDAHPTVATASMRKRMKKQAATLGQTLGLWTDGEGMFRAFQKLHYSVFGAAVKSSGDRDMNQLEQLVLLTEGMGRHVSSTELEQIESKDAITGRVIVWLNDMAAEAAKAYDGVNVTNAALMLGSLQAQDYEFNNKGEAVYLPGKITMAQLLLKRSIQMDKAENAKIIDISPELQAKYARLEGMTRPGNEKNPVAAEQALIEIFGSRAMYGLLGPAATPLGLHLTGEQFMRKLGVMHETQRTQEIRALQSDSSYVREGGSHDETGTKSLPYTLDEFVKGTSPYRILVDAMINASRYELTANAKGEVKGAKAERDAEVSRDFQTAQKQAATALLEFERLSPKDGETRVDKIRRMFAENPDQARVLLRLLPDNAIQAIYALDKDGNEILAPWLYEALAEQDSAKAEMVYWRGLLIAQWNALGGRQQIADSDSEGEQGRAFSNITRRMHRVMYRLAKSQNSMAYLEFMDALYSANDLKQFMKKVNANPAWRGDQGPLLAWIDDTADFDMDKVGGGWTKNLSGSELRLAIQDLKASTASLIEDLQSENVAWLEDAGTLNDLERQGENGELYKKMQAAIDFAGTQMEAIGPRAMVMQGVASVLGFFPSGYTKGQNPSAYRPFGLFDARRDGYGHLTSYERYLASLTTVSIDDVGGNLSQLLHDDVRTMDDAGDVVEWEKPTVEQMVEMLRNPRTRSFARAMLFPTAYEATADGYLTSKFLTGKSITGLLKGTMQQKMFETNEHGKLKHEAAMLHATAVNAGARSHGGNSTEFIRVVNDLALARTTSLQRTLTAAQADKIWNEAAQEIDELLQMAGSIRAMERTPAGMPPGTNSTLEKIRDEIRAAARSQRGRQLLAIPGEEGQLLTEYAIDQFVQTREEESIRIRQEWLTLRNAEKTREGRQRFERLIDGERDSFERLKEQAELLKSDDPFAMAVERFHVTLDSDGNVTPESLRGQQELLAYIRSTGTELPIRIPEIGTAFAKLSRQLIDPNLHGSPNLTGEEWKQLSAAAVMHYIDTKLTMAPPGAALPVYPDASKEHERRYYDPSWSYLVENLLTPGNALLEAAADLHLQAGRLTVVADQVDVVKHVANVILDENRLGTWTAEIPRQQIQANQRLDAASAEPAISMSGQAPKSQITISAATRRTTEIPPEDMLSEVVMSYKALKGPLEQELRFDLALQDKTVPDYRMTLAQLNNRFAREVNLNYVDNDGARQSVNLMDELEMFQLGLTWQGNEAVAGSGYRVITVERVRNAVEKFMTQNAGKGRVSGIQISFFHPDSQPSAPRWMRNVFYEGTSFESVGDAHQSLNNTLWFAPGSISPELQANALDANKLGRLALKVIPPAPAAEVAQMEANWDIPGGFIQMLRDKTARMMEQDFGAGTLDPHFYNAVYMNMKLRHYVRGTVNGEPVLWTAEQAIEHQLYTGTPISEVIEDAELWVPSDNVLREMLGERGTQGTRGYIDELETNPANIKRFREFDEATILKYGKTGSKAITDTVVVDRGRQTQLLVNSHISDAAKSVFELRIQQRNAMRNPIHSDRNQMEKFEPEKMLAYMASRSNRALNKQSLSLDWGRLGMPWIGPQMADSALTEILLQKYAKMKKTDGMRTGWVYEENVNSSPYTGLLSNADLGNNQLRQGLQIAPGDPVAIITSSFTSPERLKEVMDYMAGRGAELILVTEGNTEMQTLAGVYLSEAHDYETVPGIPHAMIPPERSERYQTLQAREALLTETGPITRRNRHAVWLVDGEPITENAAWFVPPVAGQEELRTIGVGLNLVPTDFLADMNVPRGYQVDAAKEKIRNLVATDEGRAYLNELLGGEADEDIDRLITRLNKNEGTVLPVAGDEFGTGDLIPLVDSNNNILFYRHGYKAPKNRQAMEKQWLQTFEGDLPEPRGFAAFKNKQESLATTHRGIVRRFFDRPGYGLAVELDIPFQTDGDKLQLEWQGMKYVIGPMKEGFPLPEHGFFPQMGMTLIADRDSSDSKQAFGERADNFRNAFAFFGVDFSKDLQDFFGLGPADTLTVLNTIARHAKRISPTMAHEMLSNEFVEPALMDAMVSLDAEQGGVLSTSNWIADLNEDSYQAAIALAAITYLMTPGAHPEHILQSGGFNDPNAWDSSRGSRLMPRLFTSVFDRAPLGSALRNEMISRINDQIYNPNNDGTGYRMLPNWDFEITTRDAEGNLHSRVGVLQIPEMHSSGDNPIKNGMAFSETDDQGAGWHSQAISWAAFGAETTHSKNLLNSKAYLENEGIFRYNDAKDGGVWRMLTETTEADKNFEAWRMPGPMELERLAMEREAMADYRTALNGSEWGTDAKASSRAQEYYVLRTQVGQLLGLNPKSEVVMDFWVRQLIGRPSGIVEDEHGNIQSAPEVSVSDAIDAMNTIKWNIERGYLPTMGGEVPAMSLIDLQMLFRLEGDWTPRSNIGGKPKYVERKDWNGWVKASLGTAVLESKTVFDPMYLLALDAFVHTYRGALPSLLNLPVSLDGLKELELLDPTTNQMYTSLSKSVNVLTRDPIILNEERASLRQLMGGERLNGRYVSKTAPASVFAKRKKARARWRYETGSPFPVEGGIADLIEHGNEYVHKGQRTTSVNRMLINLRVGTALINPALWLSAGPESWFRGTIDKAANILTMSATTGVISMQQAKLLERAAAGKAETVAEKKAAGETVTEIAAQGGILNAITGGTRYSSGTQGTLQRLYDTLADRLDFKGMISHETYYLNTRASNAGLIERGTEWYARAGAAFQDPSWGARSKTVARRYVDGVLRYVMAQPTTIVLTPESLAAGLSTNPAWVKANFPDAHQAGLNAVAYGRSLNNTLPSKIVRGIADPLSTHSSTAVQTFSNLFIRLPFLFSGYTFSVALNLTGMQGFADATAMMLDSRNNKFTRFFGRASARLNQKEFDPDSWNGFDMSDVIEGVDLAQSFLRSGATFTGLAAMGILMGGLTGEDDEMKRRRRAAEAQGAAVIYDPRDLANSLSNGNAVFLDAFPGVGALADLIYGIQAGGGSEEDRKVLAELPWVLRGFTSPIVGIARFIQTGDPRQIRWGFEDAIGSFPLVNSYMYNDAVNTYEDLMSSAAEEAKKETPEGDVSAVKMILGGVFAFENMFFENQFLNATYVATDRYDRDPFKIVKTTDTGEIREQVTPSGGQPYETGGLQDYIDEDGKLAQSFTARDYSGRVLRQMTENRATMAAVGAALSGDFWKSDFLRYNMAIKTRSFDKPEISEEEARAAVAALVTQQRGTAQFMTPQELEYAIKAEYEARGQRWDQATVEKEAKIRARQLQNYVKGQEQMGVTSESVASAEQMKLLQRADAAAVLDGIAKGTMKMGDEAMRGFYIDIDTRKQIEEDWQSDIIQEGIDFGLTETQARFRMYRIWGDRQDGGGLGSLLWSKEIGWNSSLEYNQLNTTYVTGPGGMPVATGFTRGGWTAGLGIIPTWQWGADVHGGTKNMGSGALSQDSVLNVQDLAVGINLGARALEPVNRDNRIPGDEEILKAIEDVKKAIDEKQFETSSPYNKTTRGGSGFGSFSRYGGYSGGYGGGGGGSVYYSKLYALPGNMTPYGNTVPFINTSNPIIRRADVRRERVTSERGRLNQWQ